MAKTVPIETINEIQDRCDIVEVISSYIPLKKAGRNFKACCPFHHEKTPSFIVSPDKQIFHCFGCGEGGNTLSFLIKYEHLDFRDALKMLADRAGVPLRFEETNQQQSITNELYRVNELACDFFHKNLVEKKHPGAVSYLVKRGITLETVKKFHLGVALPQWDALLTYLRNKKITIKLIEAAGLLVAKESGGFYDRFRNRLVIPILDVRGRMVAFGARALDNTMPKYINSPETSIYSKSKTLFGLNFSKEAIREHDHTVLVEGYFDVIAPMQLGFHHIVASSGTALTNEQIRLLKRYTHNLVVLFDADTAGQLAAVRSLELSLEEDMHVKVVRLPKGQDPDSFIRQFGINQFNKLIEHALTIFEFKFQMLQSKRPGRSIEDRTAIALEMLGTIKKIKNEILRSEYIKLLAERLSLQETALRKELDKIKIDQPSARWSDSNAASSKQHTVLPKAERMLMRLLFDDMNIIRDIKDRVQPDDFQNKLLGNILATILNLKPTHAELRAHHIMSYINEDASRQLISEITNEETLTYKPEFRDIILSDCLNRIEQNCISDRCRNLQEQIRQAQLDGDADCILQLQKEFHILIEKKRGLLHAKA